MASGYYPLDTRYEDGKALAEVADKLKWLLNERGEYGESPLPAAWDNGQYDNAATDGGYETYLFLALELIERCIKRPAFQPAIQPE